MATDDPGERKQGKDEQDKKSTLGAEEKETLTSSYVRSSIRRRGNVQHSSRKLKDNPGEKNEEGEHGFHSLRTETIANQAQLNEEKENVLQSVRLETAEIAMEVVKDFRREGNAIVENMKQEVQEESETTVNWLITQAKRFVDELIMGHIRCTRRIGHADNLQCIRRNQGLECGGKLRILMVGRTGDGKSSTANSLLGEEKFRVSAGSSSETKNGQRKCSTINGLDVEVVDTPGFFDTDLTDGDITLELQRSLILTAPGFHAICLVVKKGRYTKELQKTVYLVFDFFGTGVEHFALVVFTDITNQEELRQFLEIDDGDNISGPGGNRQTTDNRYAVDATLFGYFRKYGHKMKVKLKGLIEKCNENVAIINNKAETPHRDKQFRAILQTIQNIKRKKSE